MPTVADVEPIAKTLGSILAGQPLSHAAITLGLRGLYRRCDG